MRLGIMNAVILTASCMSAGPVLAGDVPCSGRVTAVGERCTQMQTDGSVGLAGDPNGAARSVVTVRPTRSFKIDGHRVL